MKELDAYVQSYLLHFFSRDGSSSLDHLVRFLYGFDLPVPVELMLTAESYQDCALSEGLLRIGIKFNHGHTSFTEFLLDRSQD